MTRRKSLASKSQNSISNEKIWPRVSGEAYKRFRSGDTKASAIALFHQPMFARHILNSHQRGIIFVQHLPPSSVYSKHLVPVKQRMIVPFPAFAAHVQPPLLQHLPLPPQLLLAQILGTACGYIYPESSHA